MVTARAAGRCSSVAVMLMLGNAAASTFPERSETCVTPLLPLRPLAVPSEALRFSPGSRVEEATIIVHVAISAEGEIESLRAACHTAVQRRTVQTALRAVSRWTFEKRGAPYDGEIAMDFKLAD